MHTEPRPSPERIDRIYLHTNEGPQSSNGALGLASYLDTIDAGYHVIVDDKNTIHKTSDDQIVWAEGGDNTHALSICMIGRAAQDWTTPYSKAEIERAAQQVAAWCRQYNIPVAHVRPGAPGQAPTDRGIAEHADDHAPSSEGHTDPGSGFPIDDFVARVATIIEGQKALERLAQWYNEVKAHPLKAGESSWKVTALKQGLNRIGMGPGNEEPFYGPDLVRDVAAFKKKYKVRNKRGDSFGGPAALALLKALA